MNMSFEEAKQAIAKVTVSRGGDHSNGTAFFIGDRYVLTALHVVADITANPPLFAEEINLKFHCHNEHSTTASVVQDLYDLDDDWVILRCTTPPEVKPLELGLKPTQDANWESFGYPDIQPAGMRVKGTVSDTNASLRMNGDEVASLRAIHLNCEEAAAGQGAQLHGLSGAPCLIDGRVAGIVRSGLEEEVYDGRKRPILYSIAGTIYATPASRIIDRQEKNRLASLPGSWAPSTTDIPDLRDCDFIVLLSQKEPDVDSKSYLTLRSVVQQTCRKLPKGVIRPPCFFYASKMISSEEHLENCIGALCRAKIVVFDATDFEPAIMFLVGIRAVVRRGVTILSVGDDYYLGKHLEVPFNITDANIVTHSFAQDKLGTINSASLLDERIRDGLININSPNYFDLPVYETIRKLPFERRGIIAAEEGVLVLCPFGEEYKTFWDDKLRIVLNEELKTLRGASSLRIDDKPPKLGVSRSFELNSHRLVSHAVYEHIRRVQSCVIDLTGWSPNVLFELGVRLAASKEHTSCIINKNWDESITEPRQKEQYSNLVSLFVPDHLRYDAALEWQQQQSVFSNAYGLDAKYPKDGPLSGRIHSLVEMMLDIDNEPASQAVYKELQDQAEFFSRAPAAGRSKPVGLFPGIKELVEREENADFERLLAAFFFISNRYTLDEIQANCELCDACYSLGDLLFERHVIRMTQEIKEKLNVTLKEIDKRKQNHD